MATRFRRLLPANHTEEETENAGDLRVTKRRSAVLVACFPCQKAKTRCSGDRPRCDRCNTRDISCEYETEPNQSRAASRRDTGEQLRQLYTHLQERPWGEALEILKRIRENNDPLVVLRFVHEGDLLLHGSFPDDTATDHAKASSRDVEIPTNVQPPICPWTSIATDGEVQDLISTFFERDQLFLMSFIDRHTFLSSMKAGLKPRHNMLFCSPLLVNAICAITAGKSKTVSGTNPKARHDLAEAFFSEAKTQFELEGGRPSIASVQALFIMFSYSCRMGRDRTGKIFRAAGYEMVTNMMPKIQRDLANGTSSSADCRAIARALWGIFCYDTTLIAVSLRVCSSVYLRPSLVPTPDVPRPCNQLAEASHSPIAPQVGKSVCASPSDDHEDMPLRYACDISEVLNKVLECASRREITSDARECSLRLAPLYTELQNLGSRLPVEEGYQGTYYREHPYLWAYYHVVAVNIARFSLFWNAELPPPLDDPREVCVRHCRGIMKHVNRCISRYTPQHQGCLTTLYFAYSCTMTLVDLLDTSPAAVQPFSQGCRVFHKTVHEYPLSNLLLAGLATVASQLGIQLPADTLSYFRDLQIARSEHEVLPLGFIVPIGSRLGSLMNKDLAIVADKGGIELGDFLLEFKREGST